MKQLLAAMLLAGSVPGALSVRLTQLRNDAGQIGCALYASEKGFPKDSSAALQTVWCASREREATCTFEPVPAGTYAVVCFHDENGDRKLDTGIFGIPTEGLAVSNDAKGFMGPPGFTQAKFTFSGAASELRLAMTY